MSTYQGPSSSIITTKQRVLKQHADDAKIKEEQYVPHAPIIAI